MATKKSVSTPSKSMALDVYLDGGNASVKFVCGGIEFEFPHAIAELTETQYDSATARMGQTSSLDYLFVNGKRYAVGASAENHDITRLQGRAKYIRNYYGVLFASAMAKAFAAKPETLNEVKVTASHAPNDVQFASSLVDAIKGSWSFSAGDKDFKFKVVDVVTYDELFGGYAQKAFTLEGGKWSANLIGSKVGVVDCGGATHSVLAIDENGNIDYINAHSGTMGINNALDRFAEILQADFNEFFSTVRVIPRDRLREALRTGEYRGKGTKFSCAEQAAKALTPLMNEIYNAYVSKLNSGASIDTLVLCGGGCAILKDRIMKRLDHGNIVLADNINTLQFANVRGAKKFSEVLNASI